MVFSASTAISTFMVQWKLPNWQFTSTINDVIMQLEKEQPPTRGVTDYQNSKATLNRPKYQGGFCYVRLLTKRKNECKQCQKEKTKGHQILKIKMIFHRHHPHSFGMRSTHPVTRLFHDKILPHSFSSDNSYLPQNAPRPCYIYFSIFIKILL